MVRKPLFFCLLNLLFLTGAQVWADPLSFLVTPMTIETPARPGIEKTGVITIEHPVSPGSDPAAEPLLRLRVYAADWTLDRSGTPQFSRSGTRGDSCSGWLQINPSEVDVPAGESRQIRYTVTVPAGVQGTYHSIIMFETAPQPMQSRQGLVAVDGRIGSALYVQIGPQVRRARITGFAVSAQKTMLTVANTGNSHVRLKGFLQFTDSQGQMVKQTPLPSAVVLPGKDNVREISMPTPTVSGGAYQVTALLDYGSDVLAGARTHVHLP